MKKKSPSRNRFTEEQQRAAVADMAAGMTLAKAAEKYGCSQSALSLWKNKYKNTSKAKAPSSRVPATANAKPVAFRDDRRVSDLEQENSRLRRLLMDSYIAGEEHPKLRRIASVLRDNTWNQLELIMEALLAGADEVAVLGEVMIREEDVLGEGEEQPDVPGQPSYRSRRKRN